MPELPEVETIRRGLERRIVGKKIKKIEIRKSNIIRNPARGFTRALTGKSFAGIARRGKLLIFDIENSGHYLLIHLKMTGQLIYQDGKKIIAGGHSFPAVGATTQPHPNPLLGKERGVNTKYSHVIFHFSDNSKLYFNDLRQFGYLQIVDQQQLAKIEKSYGLEPLLITFGLANFREVLGKRKVSIKAALLNQQLIAGIGNIYADEICFAAKVKPTRRVASLKIAEVKKLHQACRRVLQKAIRHGGTTFSNYRDIDGRHGNFTRLLKVYGRGGQKCSRDGQILKQTRVAGRGTVYCPVCQT